MKVMKKLMFAAALAAVGSAFAIESANIVGYQDKTCPEQAYYMVSSTFITTGTQNDEFDIQNVLPKVPATAYYPIFDDGVSIQELNELGEGGQIYSWMAGPDVTEYGEEAWYDGAGWYTANDDGSYSKAIKTYKRGESFIYYSAWSVEDEDGEIALPSYLQSAGEVAMEEKTFTFHAQAYYSLANYRPLSMSIQKIIPSVHKDAIYPIFDDGVSIQELNTLGEGGAIYSWMAAEGISEYAGEDWYEGAGWYVANDDGSYTKSDKEFAPGEGFIYYSAYAVTQDDPEEIFCDSYLTFLE